MKKTNKRRRKGIKGRGREEGMGKKDEQMGLQSFYKVILEVISPIGLTDRTGCWGHENLREQNSL